MLPRLFLTILPVCSPSISNKTSKKFRDAHANHVCIRIMESQNVNNLQVFLFEMDLNNTLSFFGKQLKLDTEEESNKRFFKNSKLNILFSVSKVIDQIRKHLNLEVLDFRGNTLSVLAGKLIAESLKTRRELKECIWSDMFTGRLKDEIPLVLDALGEALTASGCRLTTLDLSDNAFGAGLSTCLFNKV